MKILLLLTLLLAVASLTAQDVVDEVFFDNNGTQVENKADASYVGQEVHNGPELTFHILRLSDNVVVHQEQFIKEDNKEKYHGVFFEIDEATGDTVLLHYYDRNEPVGVWRFPDKDGTSRTLDYTFDINDNIEEISTIYAVKLETEDEENTEEVEQEEMIFRVVEEQPEFPGGIDKMYQFINEQIIYPPGARADNIEGVVHLEFVVNEEGYLSDIRVLRGPDIQLNKEAVRALREMPQWKPGRQRGKPVQVYYNIPIRFQLQ